jgi:hypothetical protein
MFIRNVEKMMEEKLFYCKSPKLKVFLTENHGISYVNKKKQDFKFVWIFLKTPLLDKALTEWSDNKQNGTLAFK